MAGDTRMKGCPLAGFSTIPFRAPHCQWEAPAGHPLPYRGSLPPSYLENNLEAENASDTSTSPSSSPSGNSRAVSRGKGCSWSIPLSFLASTSTAGSGQPAPRTCQRALASDARLPTRANGFSQVKVLQAARASAIFSWDKVTVLLETVRSTIKPIDQSLELALRRDA